MTLPSSCLPSCQLDFPLFPLSPTWPNLKPFSIGPLLSRPQDWCLHSGPCRCSSELVWSTLLSAHPAIPDLSNASFTVLLEGASKAQLWPCHFLFINLASSPSYTREHACRLLSVWHKLSTTAAPTCLSSLISGSVIPPKPYVPPSNWTRHSHTPNMQIHTSGPLLTPFP